MDESKVKDSLRAIFKDFYKDLEGKKEPIGILVERYVARVYRLLVEISSGG